MISFAVREVSFVKPVMDDAQTIGITTSKGSVGRIKAPGPGSVFEPPEVLKGRNSLDGLWERLETATLVSFQTACLE